MFHNFSRHLLAFLLIHTASAKTPDGIWVLDKEPECGSVRCRIELAGQSEAFLKTYQGLRKGTARETPRGLLLEFPPKEHGDPATTLVLKPTDDAFTDQHGNKWIPRKRLVEIDPAWTPVTVKVLDQHGKPLDHFQYSYSIEYEKGRWSPLLVRPQDFDPDHGGIAVRAPDECLIHLAILHPNIIDGYNNQPEARRKKGDREIVACVELGKTVSGIILSAATGQPVSGARIAPMMFCPPSFLPNREKSVVTGRDGSFLIHGVDFSYSVRHPDFVGEDVYLTEDKEKSMRIDDQTIRLDPGETLAGVVCDTEGKPLDHVTIRSWNGKTALSGKDGAFTLCGLSKRMNSRNLSFSKPGYADATSNFTEILKNKRLAIMRKFPVFRGQVVFPGGSPARSYRILCGPGKAPASFECSNADVSDPQGRFSIQPEDFPENGEEFWLGILAENTAPWEGVFPLHRLTGGQLRITLKEGVGLVATIKLPASSKAPVSAKLVPTDRPDPDSIRVTFSHHPGKTLATQETALPKDGKLRFGHLRPGNYRLILQSDDTTPVFRPVVVADEPVDLGTIRMPGTGSISGIAHRPYEPGKPWSFADGDITVPGLRERPFEPCIEFKAGSDGKFFVEHVPCGIVIVSISHHLSADMITSRQRKVRVLEGQTSEVRFVGAEGAWAQPLQLTFGGKDRIPAFKTKRIVGNINDRAPMFDFDLSPANERPVSWPLGVDWRANGKSRPAIPDISQGKWKIKVFDWLGSRGFNDGLRAEVNVQIDADRSPVVIPLGDRAITGKILSQAETRRHIRVIAIENKTGRNYYSRCDRDGDFIVRYLPEGSYQIHAHDDDGGWCSAGNCKTSSTVVDIGEHRLQPGGKIDGNLPPDTPASRNISITASGPGGLEIPLDTLESDGSFSFGNMPPGKWTIQINDSGKPIARHTAKSTPGKQPKQNHKEIPRPAKSEEIQGLLPPLE